MKFLNEIFSSETSAPWDEDSGASFLLGLVYSKMSKTCSQSPLLWSKNTISSFFFPSPNIPAIFQDHFEFSTRSLKPLQSSPA